MLALLYGQPQLLVVVVVQVACDVTLAIALTTLGSSDYVKGLAKSHISASIINTI